MNTTAFGLIVAIPLLLDSLDAAEQDRRHRREPEIAMVSS
jgi:hypothetical protein